MRSKFSMGLAQRSDMYLEIRAPCTSRYILTVMRSIWWWCCVWHVLWGSGTHQRCTSPLMLTDTVVHILRWYRTWLFLCSSSFTSFLNVIASTRQLLRRSFSCWRVCRRVHHILKSISEIYVAVLKLSPCLFVNANIDFYVQWVSHSFPLCIPAYF